MTVSVMSKIPRRSRTSLRLPIPHSPLRIPHSAFPTPHSAFRTPTSMRSLFLTALLLASCAVGPNYDPPSAELEASFKNVGFKSAPAQGSWWTLFNDPKLNELIRTADRNSPTARAALARYDQSRAALGLSLADAYPSVTGEAYARRRTDSGNTNFSAGTYNDYRSALNLSWEIDLWGRVRRQVGAAVADMQAAEYEFQAAALSLRGEVTRTYLSLRFADAEIDLLSQTESLRREARSLMKTRFNGGASSRIDHERSITEHESVRAELEQLRAQRARYENALATLTGQNASGFRLAPNAQRPSIPGAPSAVPGDLLRRRPDIAAAERRLAAASENIGLAIANALPRFSITATGGYGSLKSSDLFNQNSQLWNIGPEVSIPLLQGGRGKASTESAKARYREALEAYRDTLLRAVEETENALTDSHHLAVASQSRKRGSQSSATAAQLTRKRYEAGVTDYFEVIDADRTSLTGKRGTLSVDLARVLASTALIQSLGGGWQR